MSHYSQMSGPCRLVMIVEDETRLRDMLAHAVADMGFDAVAARSGEQALKMMEQRTADVVMLDLNLPGIGGIDVFERSAVSAALAR